MNTFLYLIDMSHAGNTSGVDRYISTLLRGLRGIPHLDICWIHLRHDNELLFSKEEQMEYYTKITIPLPQDYDAIIAEKYWIKRYNQQILRLTRHLFEGRDNCVLHLHTLNLIDLALLIKEHFPCKIITHLHCIPWKGSFNSDRLKFHRLYEDYYVRKKWEDKNSFLTNHGELQSYTQADKIVCVTECAAVFLQKVMQIPERKIAIIPNGIDDFRKDPMPATTANRQSIKILRTQ